MSTSDSDQFAPQPHVFAVSELNQKIKHLLEEKYPFLWITGEISNFRKPASGHCYFTLKDDRSQIGCVLFRTQASALRFNLEDGLSLIGLGRIAVYEPRGTYQVVFEYVDPKGLGGLQLAFEALKKKLRTEGLFDDQHKRALPAVPRKISIITSPSGAAVRDVLNVAYRRYPNLWIEIVGASVQGERATEEIQRALHWLDGSDTTEVIVLARGGGSIEDLAPFNDERLARAIFACKHPVVSAIGHETDFTIADFVADLRAPTPSAAAEIVVPRKRDLQYQVQTRKEKLTYSMDRLLKMNRKHLDGLSRRIVHPKRRIQDNRLRLEALCLRFSATLRNLFSRKRQRLERNQSMLKSHTPEGRLKLFRKQLADQHRHLVSWAEQHLKRQRVLVANYDSRLDALNPEAILKRGYSITRTVPDRTIVRRSRQVAVDQPIEILLGEGLLEATIDKTGARSDAGRSKPNKKEE